MALANILGIFLLLSWPRTNVASLVPVVAMWQSTQAQENQPSDSSQQGPATQPPTDQQKAPDQASRQPQSSAPASPPCPDNSQTGSNVKTDCKPATSTGSKTKKHPHKTVAPVTTPAAGTGPTKTVVPNGGANDATVDLSAGVSPQQASHQKESTNQLLATSDANLKKIAGRELSPSQQDTVTQINSYIRQAKDAEKVGDVQRAHNLAVKASLLSADLVGPEK
jgi:hypothetical protein